MKKTLIIGGLLLIALTTFNLNGNTSLDQSTGSNYIIIFQVTDYSPKITETIDFIFKKMVKKTDRLTIFSPIKPYSFSKKTRETQTTDKLIALTNKVLRKDILQGAYSYHQILKNMKQSVIEMGAMYGINSPAGDIKSTGSGGSNLRTQFVNYKRLLKEMRGLRTLDQDFLIKLTNMLKTLKGKNHIYIVYQKRLKFVPIRRVMNALRSNPNVKFDAMELFQASKNDEFINVQEVKKALNESKTTLNFFYVKGVKKKNQGVDIKEFSSDVYNIFSKLTKATNGTLLTTSKPKKAFEETINK